MNKINTFMVAVASLSSLIPTHYAYAMRATGPHNQPTFDSQITQAILSRSQSRVTKVLNAHPESINKLHSFTHQAPLHVSIARCCNNITTLLVEKQADINIKCGNEHMTPLYYAVMYGNAKIVMLLLEQNANTEIATKDGQTPLHKAAQCQGPSSHYIFNKLIAAKASIDCKDNNGKNLLDVACSNSIKNSIRDLLQSKAHDSAPARQIMVDQAAPQPNLIPIVEAAASAQACPAAVSTSSFNMPAPAAPSLVLTAVDDTPAILDSADMPIILAAADTSVNPGATIISAAAQETPEINDQIIGQQTFLFPETASIIPTQESAFPHESIAQEPQQNEVAEIENYSDEDDKYESDQEISLEQWVLINTQE